MNEIALLVSLLSLALVLVVWLRVTRLERQMVERGSALREEMTARDSDLFCELENLLTLYRALDPRRSIPATRGWAASPDFLVLLADHAATTRPRVVVECGSGVSTVVLARVCERNRRGHVWSLEHLPHLAERTRGWLAEQGLSDFATVLDAPLVTGVANGAAQPWYATDGLPDSAIDMLIVDGPPGSTASQARYPAGPRLFPRLAADGVVFLDDSHRHDERAVLQRWRAEFPDLSVSTPPCEKGAAVLRRERAAAKVAR